MQNPFSQIRSAIDRSMDVYDPAKKDDAEQKEKLGILYDPAYERQQTANYIDESEQRQLEAAKDAAAKREKEALAAVDKSSLTSGQRQATQVKVGDEFKATKGYDPSKGSGMFSGIADYVGANVDDYAELANRAYKQNYLMEGDKALTFEESVGASPDGFGKLSRLMLAPYKGPSAERIQQTQAQALESLRGLNLSPSEYAAQEARIKKEHEVVYQKELERITADMDKKLALEEEAIRTQMQSARDQFAATTAKQDEEVVNLDAKLTESLGEAVAFSLLTEFKKPAELQGFIDSKGGDRYLQFLKGFRDMANGKYNPDSVPSEYRDQYEKLWKRVQAFAGISGGNYKGGTSKVFGSFMKDEIAGYRGN